MNSGQHRTARRGLSTLALFRGLARFRRLLRRPNSKGPAEALYLGLVRQARQPGFYQHAGVPDTLDGRFDLIVLHLFLLLQRLKGLQSPAAELGQGVYDVMFADMDRNLREMGVADLGVGKHVKRMVRAFHGRAAAYEMGLAADDAELEAALRRNLYGTTTPSSAEVALMAAYLRREAGNLAAQPTQALLAGAVHFGPAPGSASPAPATGRYVPLKGTDDSR